MKEIGTDFQGWPICAMTLREVLKRLGFEDDGNEVKLPSNSEILDAYPMSLADDGMAYGVDERFFTCVDKETYDSEIRGEKVKVFNIFRDIVTPKEDGEEKLPTPESLIDDLASKNNGWVPIRDGLKMDKDGNIAGGLKL